MAVMRSIVSLFTLAVLLLMTMVLVTAGVAQQAPPTPFAGDSPHHSFGPYGPAEGPVIPNKTMPGYHNLTNRSHHHRPGIGPVIPDHTMPGYYNLTHYANGSSRPHFHPYDYNPGGPMIPANGSHYPHRHPHHHGFGPVRPEKIVPGTNRSSHRHHPAFIPGPVIPDKSMPGFENVTVHIYNVTDTNGTGHLPSTGHGFGPVRPEKIVPGTNRSSHRHHPAFIPGKSMPGFENVTVHIYNVTDTNGTGHLPSTGHGFGGPGPVSPEKIAEDGFGPLLGDLPMEPPMFMEKHQ